MQYDTAVQRGKAPEKYRKAPFTVRLVRFLKYIPVFLLLFGFAFLLLAPLLWMCLGAFKSDPEVLSYPPKYFPVMNHFPENWANVLKQIDFMGMTVNTAIYAIGTTIPACLSMHLQAMLLPASASEARTFCSFCSWPP